ncbi:hypothetical protein THITH_09910 [Thioalkalivibrio paradoxus ARh 1]|uniref:Glycosyltransferase RgtA/B/C/D-like domain-containing protein n=1 Tax=Thioalkalivibrio paradoxus ARh 1 TaxID=713585 RepID=W0DNE5_9GAMM|nr:hypothetical protein THITH_09910 [Thioalkalivibrio paradoxus ARh 1]
MSVFLAALVAVLLPWIATALWLRRSGSGGEPLGWPIALGYGYFLGLFLTVLLLRIWDSLGLGLNVVLTLSTWFFLVGVWILWSYRRRGRSALASQGSVPGFASGWQRWVWYGLAALIALRLGVLGAEVLWRPLTPWDAWTVWALRAELWAYAGTLVPFVPRAEWLASEVTGAYTIDAHHYPKTVSLIPAWIALVSGVWIDGLALLPWLGAVVALLLGLYGQVKRFGGTPWEAMLVAYVVVSLPMLGVHTALAGYADLWLAAAIGLGGVALWSWWQRREGIQGLLAGAMLLALPTLKVEGWVWLVPLLGGLVLAWVRPLYVLLAAAFLATGVLAWGQVTGEGAAGFAVHGWSLWLDQISIPGLIAVQLAYEPEVWKALVQALFVFGSWHLLWFVLLPVLTYGAVRAGRDAVLRIPVYTLFVALLLMGFLFTFTDASQWAVSFTSVNRLLLHFVPLSVFAAWWILRVGCRS